MNTLAPKKEIVRLRLALIVGALLLCCFVWADIVLVPTKLHALYFYNRFTYQLPIIVAIIAFSFTRYFYANRFLILTLLMVLLTYTNYWLIYQLWERSEFVFPYEGTILYAFYCVFALGINYRLAILASTVNALGFVGLMVIAPVYGERVFISAAFVTGSLFICAYAKYRLDYAISLLASTNKKLATLSRVDPLTNLLNRRALMQSGEKLLSLAHRESLHIAVIMLDLDDFKQYNDSFGHQQGDDAIVAQADIMREVFQRETDILGRYGGEEFMIIVSGLDSDSVGHRCKQIKQSWQSREMKHANGATHDWVTCSIGAVVLSPAKQLSLDELVTKADGALYKAKHAGKNTFEVVTLS